MLGENSLSGSKVIPTIWSPPPWKVQGAWFWWFWLFFIHDENTLRTGKCRQLMILWSIKKDGEISCNGLEIKIPVQLERKGNALWQLNGAAAAWYFDGERMHHDFVLEKSQMELDGEKLSLAAPGDTPSSFFLDGKDFVTRIKSGEIEFEFLARQVDHHAAIGPNHGVTSLPLGMAVEGTRIESFHLSGTERNKGGAQKRISGTAYFQKILVAAPPPQWYWGVYHFPDGSFFTYMLPYIGRAALAGGIEGAPELKSPTAPIQQDITFYHAPSGRVFEGKRLRVVPKHIGNGLWSHEISGSGTNFEISATARAYSHSCWKFTKNISLLPAKSTFRYNEYPSVLERIELRTKGGEKIELKNGWGNMENSWGFLI